MEHLDFSFPLKSPVLIFSLVLFIILFAPIILNRLKIPPIIGLIIAGAVIGPNGLNLMLRDSSILLFGTVGLLYIMFLAGLEIDMADFKKNKYKSLLFGMYTFLIPMALGTASSYYFLEFSLPSSILLASMFASHTLIAYPIVSRFGITKNRAVNITVGGTIITDTLALLVLAVIVGMTRGEVNQEFWITLSVSLLIFSVIVLLVLPYVARLFFKYQEDAISQYIFVLGIVFLSAFLAEMAGIEAIIGAFLAGLALNRLIPHTSALMNRIEFVGNALFIPFFLIGVGMLIDFRVFLSGTSVLVVAATMTVVATVSKLLAAYFSRLSFGFSRNEFLLMFGLSNAQAAATLAAVLVGYNIILETLPDGTVVRLLNEDILNGSILMILITCTISSFAANNAAREIALLENAKEEEGPTEVINKVLIPVSHPETLEPLVSFSSLLYNKKKGGQLIALHVKTDADNGSQGKKLLEKAQKAAAAFDTTLNVISRHDLNISNGILYTIKENLITDLVLGMHSKTNFADTFYGTVLEPVINKTDNNIFILKMTQPISTLKKIIVVVPEKAEYETGFIKWVQKIQNISKELNCDLLFYSGNTTAEKIQKVLLNTEHNLPVSYKLLDEWEDFLIIARDLNPDDLMVVVSARKNTLSYNLLLDRVPKLLAKYFEKNNTLILFPEQFTESELHRRQMDGSIDDLIEENLQRIDSLGKYFKSFIKKK